MRKSLALAISWLEVAEATACVLSLLTIFVLVIANVIWRYVLNDPLIWTHEVVVYLFTGFGLVSISLVLKRQGHINFDIVYLLCGPIMRRVLRATVYTVLAGLFIVLIQQGLHMHEMYSRFVSPLNHIPRGLISGTVLYSFASMFLTCLYFLWEEIAGPGSRPVLRFQRLGFGGELSQPAAEPGHGRSLE